MKEQIYDMTYPDQYMGYIVTYLHWIVPNVAIKNRAVA